MVASIKSKDDASLCICVVVESTGSKMQGMRWKSVALLLVWIVHCSVSQRQNRGMNPDIESLLSSLQEGSSLEGESHPFHSLTPTTPTPENTNCYVEIVPPIRVGGVCKRLGRQRRRGRMGRRHMPITWACQAGIHLEIGSPHCGRRFRQMNG